MEFANGTFYQASCGGSLVAIIADYPGLLAMSYVSKAEVLTSKKESFFMPHLDAHMLRLYRNDHQDAARNPWGLLSNGRWTSQAKKEGS